MSEEKSKKRLVSLDTYRGLVLVLLMLESVEYGWQHVLAKTHPSGLTKFIEYHASHVDWSPAFSMWDLIQPSFMFMVGVSMAYSYGSRLKKGDSFGQMFRHAAVRSLVLIMLGIFLRTTYTMSTNWTFEDVITQMGLGYVFLFLLWNRGAKVQLGAIAAILVGYWALFAFWPVRDAIVDSGWAEPQAHVLSGLGAHWNINANPGHYFDQWFLNWFGAKAPNPDGSFFVWLTNLFRRDELFEIHGEGYNTLNFIPSLALMIMGLMAGELLRSKRTEAAKLKQLLIYGGGGILAGVILHFTGLCPLVKKAWTSGFTLYSGGCCLLILAALFFIIDVKQIRKWTFPFVVCGMNSIALYCMLWLLGGGYPTDGEEAHWMHWIDVMFGKFLGDGYASFLGEGFEPLLKNIFNGIVLWLICFWMYRRKIFLRI